MNDQPVKIMAEPLTENLYRRSIGRESAEEISGDPGTPIDHAPVRIKAEARYLNQQHWDLLAVAVNASGA